MSATGQVLMDVITARGLRSSSALFLVAANAIFMAAGYGIHFYLGRTMGPVSYGSFGVVLGLMNTAVVLFTNGVPQAISRRLALSDYGRDTAGTAGLLLQLERYHAC